MYNITINDIDIYYLYEYIPYNDTNHNEVSKIIMDIKHDTPFSDDWKERNRVDNINKIKIELSEFLNSFFKIDNNDILLCIFPSSEKEKYNDNLIEIAKHLESKYNFKLQINLLERYKDVPKAHKGNDRSVEKHLYSIKINNLEYDGIKYIIILDDVCTTGNSFIASNMLIRKKFSDIKIFNIAIGRTVRG